MDTHPQAQDLESQIDSELVSTMEKLTGQMEGIDRETSEPVTGFDDIRALIGAILAAFSKRSRSEDAPNGRGDHASEAEPIRE